MPKTAIYFDYTCGDSRSLKQLIDTGELRPEIEWRTFSLKENRLQEGEPSFFAGTTIESISILALALSHAARTVDFDAFHDACFGAFGRHDPPATEEELFEAAAKAGVDLDKFRANQGHWLHEVADEHRTAVERWEVFGTPTAVLAGQSPVYLELDEIPADRDRAASVWDSIKRLALEEPSIWQFQRSARSALGN